MSLPELTCQACGHTGYDVASSVVEVDPTNRDVKVTDRAVPELFRVESRCIDHDACAERVLETTP